MSKPLAAAGERMLLTVLCLQSSFIFRISSPCSASSPPTERDSEYQSLALPNDTGRVGEKDVSNILFDEGQLCWCGDIRKDDDV
ncbi:hypothetical protein CEXT_166571 [Caerostris extrusa]|uniref:Uncharacterized protein n=1 Tax=Caerostris extrusa TaxID=172846 RepID=A0AAV4SZF8_CAEEX|nr:hypothetical protein CEXT_166571 [Caerostris extrusa]